MYEEYPSANDKLGRQKLSQNYPEAAQGTSLRDLTVMLGKKLSLSVLQFPSSVK